MLPRLNQALLSGRLFGAVAAAAPGPSSASAVVSCSYGSACCSGSASSSAPLLLASGRRTLATESRSMLGGGVGPATQILGPAAEAHLQKIKSKHGDARGGSILRTMWRFTVRSILAGAAVSTVAALYYGQYELKELDAMVEEARRKQQQVRPQAHPHLQHAVAAAATGSVPALPAAVANAVGAEVGRPAASGERPASSDAPPLPQAEVPAPLDVQAMLSGAWADAMEFYLETRRNVTRRIKEFSDPTYHKLLPDLQPELRGRIKTLVLDLDELLVHKEWSRSKGWLIYKRPGAMDFIQELGQYFEIVVYTDEPNTWADPVLNKLDPNRAIQYRLFRPETQYHNGKHVRDLSKLNRDMGEVLFLSAKPEAWDFQPENTIKLKPWTNSANDTMLLDLIPFLQLIATKGVKDVRDVVRAYDGVEDIPKAFRERMKQLSEQHKAPQKRSFLGWQK